MDGDEARVLAVLLRAADRHSVPVTYRQVEALARDVAVWLAGRERPADEEETVRVAPAVERVVRVVARRPARPGGVPSVEQLDSLVEKARSRRLSGAEVERLVAGIPKLRVFRREG